MLPLAQPRPKNRQLEFSHALTSQRENDPESSLMHYRARSYDSRIGRFVQKDPLENESGVYHYTENDPIRNTDPSGLFTLRYCRDDIKDRVLRAFKRAQFRVMSTPDQVLKNSPFGRTGALGVSQTLSNAELISMLTPDRGGPIVECRSASELEGIVGGVGRRWGATVVESEFGTTMWLNTDAFPYADETQSAASILHEFGHYWWRKYHRGPDPFSEVFLQSQNTLVVSNSEPSREDSEGWWFQKAFYPETTTTTLRPVTLTRLTKNQGAKTFHTTEENINWKQ